MKYNQAVFMLKSCIDYLTELKSNTYIASFDISKAYDSFSNCEMLRVMVHKGFHEKCN